MLLFITKLITTVVIIFGFYLLYQLNQTPPLPKLKKNPWWGHGIQNEDNTAIKPFKISIPDKDIEDLKIRLSLPLRLTPVLKNANFTYGFNQDILNSIIQYWTQKYDWREREKRINSFSHFKTQIEGLDIHFLHVKPKNPSKSHKIKPLLLLHGWPGSFIEFDKIIPMLTSPHPGSDVVFEVICPSIPGYGFSQSSSKPGLGGLETAQIFLKLMKRLGFEQFYVQGGDWGSFIASIMTTLYPENVIGMHLNMMLVNTPLNNLKYFLGAYLPSGLVIPPDAEEKMYPISSFFSILMRESGYMHIQSTKPDTIGVALSNSPVGLAAYILEKFSGWTNLDNQYKPDGGLLSKDFPISLDRILDNICIYWFSQSITTSMRYYAENIAKALKSTLDRIPTDVPAGFSSFKNEIANHPKNFLANKYKNIVMYKFHQVGGHFAAMERPEILAKDVHEFVNSVEMMSASQTKSEL